MAMPVNSATIVGPETNAYESCVMMTKSERPISGAVDDGEDGHDARAVGDCACGPAPAVQCGNTLDDVGARGRHLHDKWNALTESGSRGVGDDAGGFGRECPAVLGGIDVDPHHEAIDRGEMAHLT